jgi:short-subunit dehydrogenase
MITGSSDGIGLAFAKKLLEINYNLIMHARNKNKMEEILKNFGGENKLNIS